MALKFQPPQGVDTTSPNEAFNKGLGNSIVDLPTLYLKTKLARMQQDKEIKALQFDQEYKNKDLGLKESANAIAQQRENRMGEYQKELIDIKERLAALAEKTGEVKQIAAEQKIAKDTEKQEGIKAAAVKQADRVIGKVDEAVSLVGGKSAGFGALLKKIPATNAKALDSTLKTIKANLGFAELQEMRRNSPTGGALGQVAVQELEALQATVSALDQDQDPELLKKNLLQVKTHYENWKKAVEGSEGEQLSDGGGNTEVPTVTSQEAYDALPSGTEYIDGNGNRAKKK